MKPITLTDNQTKILTLLYRFRFLTRSQIQRLLILKSHSKLIPLLNKLETAKYVIKQQSSSSAMAYYSLGNEGRKYLIAQKLVKQPRLLNRVWRESGYSTVFREKCVLIADLYLDLLVRSGGALRFWTKTDLAGMEHLPEPAPDIYFVIGEKSEAKRFFVEVLTNPKTKNTTEQIERYSDYYHSNEWQMNITKDFPLIVLLCPHKSMLKATNRYIKENYSDEPDLRFLVSSDRSLTLDF